MAFCRAKGFLAYNTTDLHPYGFINRKLVLEYPERDSPSPADLNNPQAAQTFKQVQLTDDDGNPVFDENGDPILVWIETRIILPANTLQIEFLFRSRNQSQNETLVDINNGSLFGLSGLGGGTGSIAASFGSQTFLGGISTVKSRQCWQILSSKTKINMIFRVNEELRRNNGIIELPGYIVSVLGAFQEPIELDESQIARLGDPLETPHSRNGYVGDTDADGVFDGLIIDGGSIYKGEEVPPLFDAEGNQTPRNVFDSKNLLLKVLKDSRLHVFRADNDDISPQPYADQMPVLNFNDVTANKIQVDLSPYGGKDGDIYVTACLTTKRLFREFNVHTATFAETPDRSGVGTSGGFGGGGSEILPIRSDVVSYHYHPVKWRVIKKDVEENAAGKTLDQAYLDSIKVPLSVFTETAEAVPEEDRNWDIIEGWRLSGMITLETELMIAADSTGIVLVRRNGESGVNETDVRVVTSLILARNNILDQEWFDQYLIDNNLNDIIFSDGMKERDFTGTLFDLSEHVNSLVQDGRKIPYSRIFALALRKVNRAIGVGYPNVDLVTNNLIASGNRETRFDLSTAVFKEVRANSFDPRAWNAASCSGPKDFGGWYDPNDPFNKWSFLIPTPPGDFAVDWLLSTPFYQDKFNRESRIFVEMFQPNGLRKNPSRIYALTFPSPESSLSFDYTFHRDESFAFFENLNSETLSYYQFTNGISQQLLSRLRPFLSGNHNKGEFVFNNFKYVGYSLAAGQLPDYSEGGLFANDRVSICTQPGSDGNPLTFDSVYTRGSWIVPQITGDSFEITDMDEENLYRDIVFDITVSQTSILSDTETGRQELNGGGDNMMAIEFKSSNQVLSNIFLPYKQGNHRIVVDGKFYGGSPIVVHSNMLSRIKINSIDVVYTTRDKIESFLIKGRQTAVAIDGYNRIHVFYNDEASGNISCSVSADLGNTWWIFRDIIRLEAGETAELPYVIPNKNSNEIVLFYILNGRFLMVKRISTEWFVCEDQFQSYTPPESGTIRQNMEEVASQIAGMSASSLTEFQNAISTTDNTDFSDLRSKMDVGLDNFTEGGKQLRRQTSYFVQAEKKDQFFIDEDISSKAVFALQFKGEIASPRFAFGGDINAFEGEQMDVSIEGGSYAVYKDNRSKFRVVLGTSDGRISWKTNDGNLTHWYYDVRRFPIHKNLFNEDPEVDDLSVDNPQVLYDSINDDVYLFYFHKQCLFVRRFNNEALYPRDTTFDDINTQSEEEYTLNDGIKEHIEIVRESSNLPIFLVGNLEQQIADRVNLDSSLPLNDANRELVIQFYYEDPTLFTQNFAVDVNSKPVGYLTEGGILRLLYRSEEGNIFGLTLNGMIPTLDVRKRYGDSTVNG